MPPAIDVLRARQALRGLLPAVRAAAPVSLCLAAGQLMGRTDVGLVMAVGARRVAIADPHGEPASRGANVALAAGADAVAVFLGTLAGIPSAVGPRNVCPRLGGRGGKKPPRGSRPAGRGASRPLRPRPTSSRGPGRSGSTGAGRGRRGRRGPSPFSDGFQRLAEVALARARASLALLAAAASHPAEGSRFGLLLAGTVTGCLLAVRALGVPRGNWVVVSTLLVLRPEAGGTRRRALERLEGTLLGCALAGGLLILLHSVVLTDLLIFLLLVGYFRLPPGSPWALAFFTPALVLGVGRSSPAIGSGRSTERWTSWPARWWRSPSGFSSAPGSRRLRYSVSWFVWNPFCPPRRAAAASSSATIDGDACPVALSSVRQ